jgi:hypothetical protein
MLGAMDLVLDDKGPAVLRRENENIDVVPLATHVGVTQVTLRNLKRIRPFATISFECFGQKGSQKMVAEAVGFLRVQEPGKNCGMANFHSFHFHHPYWVETIERRLDPLKKIIVDE